MAEQNLIKWAALVFFGIFLAELPSVFALLIMEWGETGANLQMIGYQLLVLAIFSIPFVLTVFLTVALEIRRLSIFLIPAVLSGLMGELYALLIGLSEGIATIHFGFEIFATIFFFNALAGLIYWSVVGCRMGLRDKASA